MSRKPFLILAAAAALQPAGYTQAGMMNATIPFDFYVGKHLLPAGEYVVQPVAPEMQQIRSKDNKFAASMITMAIVTERRAAEEKLVFNRYGNTHFLAQIWWSGLRGGRELLKSGTEMQLAKTVPVRRVILNATDRRKPTGS